MLDRDTLRILEEAAKRLDAGFASLPGFRAEVPGRERLMEVLAEVAERLHDNYPYFHPLYAGQMLKPPHPVARLAYALAMWVNPNNHALDGGRASSAMEKEAVAQIAEMFGWKEHLGHLCSGGTMANLEALWVCGQLAPGKTVLASSQSHYTHRRVCGALQMPYEEVPCDDQARMDIQALERRMKQGDVAAVVATVGATATGALDSLPQIVELCNRRSIRLHVDSAYGGYFGLASNLSERGRQIYA